MKRKRFAILSGLLAVLLVAGGVFIYHEREEQAKYYFDKRHSDPDAIYGGEEGSEAEAEGENLKARVGNGNERGPQSAEEENYLNRAYPATDIPFAATVNAQNAFVQVKGRGQGKNSPGQWTLIGPSSATVPDTLSFYGGVNAKYITSGRITALAIDPDCSSGKCRLWVAAAGGGIWRTDNALSGSGASWTFVSGSFATNAIGTLTYDAAHSTLYAGTGEPNASSDSEAGLGIYKSTDGGSSWSKLAAQTTVGSYTGGAFDARSISAIVLDPTNANTMYVASTRGVRGVSSVTGGATTTPPVAAPFGLYKSTDGGANFSFIWNGNGTIRGVNHVELDPSSPTIVYAAAFQQGIWRSTDGGANWTQIKTPLNPTQNTDRAEFAVTKLPSGKTRMYAGIGAAGAPNQARFYRTDDASGAAAFTDLTTPATLNYCSGQCWYDNYVVTPAGKPDIVYLGGSHQYGEIYGVSNGRGVVLSTDAGATFTDMTVEGGTPNSAINLHPDHHALVVAANNPYMFFEGSDGGLVRSNGNFVDASASCTSRGLSGAGLAICQQLLSRIPERLISLNKGLSTLQFQSLLNDPNKANSVIGGTQDNGTWLNNGSSQNWGQTIYGDGGQSGFNATDSKLMFNTFTGQATDVNFRNGDPTKWVIAAGPIAASPESAAFYPPVISDPNPANAGTIFQGSQSVWRTQDWGGDRDYLEANCPEFTTSAANPDCGDFVRIGPAGATDLTSAAYGADRAGNVLAAIERTPADTGTLWVATATGRVFISKNADAAAGSVTYKRLDSLATNDPGRFVSSIFVDAANPNHAWISYSGYNFNTPAQPGHVFSVTYDPVAGTATWTNLDGGTGPMGDLPVTDLVQDSVTGDLYAATDFGVLRLASGSTTWTVAGSGLPMVEVPGLTIVPGSRVLYAATHGRSAWQLKLP